MPNFARLKRPDTKFVWSRDKLPCNANTDGHFELFASTHGNDHFQKIFLLQGLEDQARWSFSKLIHPWRPDF
jgi:hypothetical protein